VQERERRRTARVWFVVVLVITARLRAGGGFVPLPVHRRDSREDLNPDGSDIAVVVVGAGRQ
jgi:hypothetical protein